MTETTGTDDGAMEIPDETLADLQRRFGEISLSVDPGPPERLDAYIKAENEKLSKKGDVFDLKVGEVIREEAARKK